MNLARRCRLGAELKRALFASGQPTILAIMSDEDNSLISDPFGNTIVQTLNMDALAARGIIYSCEDTGMSEVWVKDMFPRPGYI